MFQVAKTCLLLGTLLLSLSFPAWPQNSDAEGNPQVIVSVYNDAGVSPDVLIQADAKAAKIFAQPDYRLSGQTACPPETR